ncbi:hypothetical protein GCM10010246_13260 [Streptomyces cuspidosporus]|uniref:Transposase n=1 Tax=Streptomyces cuspidosporus TaxID=66882 RepID=A0ABP5SHQ2_9ACTN
MDKTFGRCTRQAERSAGGAKAGRACPQVLFTEARPPKVESVMGDSARDEVLGVYNARACEQV